LYSLHKIPVSILFFVFVSQASAQDFYILSAGAEQTGMGNSCIARPGFWSSFYNQASLAFQKHSTAGINYENRFNIRELGTRAAGIIIPAGRATLGAVYSNFGYKYFSRHTAGMACGMKLSGKIAAGLQIDYFLERTPGEHTQRSALTFEAGMILTVTETTAAGFRIFNPLPGSLRKNFLPSSIQSGVEVKLSRSLSVTAEAELATGGKARISMGLDYSILQRLQVRGGFRSGAEPFCFGLGYRMKMVKFDFGFMIHERLGITSSASVIYEFNTK